MAAKELMSITASAALWGTGWQGKKVVFRCNNMATVAALSNRTARDPIMVHLLRCLFFFQVKYKFEYTASNIPGKENSAADALSRNRLPMFLSLSPQAVPTPTIFPNSLKDLLLLLPPPPWTSTHWASLFRASLREVSQRVR